MLIPRSCTSLWHVCVLEPDPEFWEEPGSCDQPALEILI